jgi:hypothetical protein
MTMMVFRTIAVKLRASCCIHDGTSRFTVSFSFLVWTQCWLGGLGMVATEFSVYHLSFSILFSFVIYDTGRA